MLQKKYIAAIDNLEKCMELTKGRFITEQDLQARKSEFSSFEEQFQPTAKSILKNTMRKPTETSVRERPELESRFNEFAKANNELFEYVLKATTHRKFLRRKEQIEEDASFALAIAHKLGKSGDLRREIEKTEEKEDKIEDEIKRLEQELQEAQ